MATYDYINLQSSEDVTYDDNEQVTKNFKLSLIGNDYQTTDILYRANLEKLAILTEALVINSPAASPSGDNFIIGIGDMPVRGNDIDSIDLSVYRNKSVEKDDTTRVLYLIKED